jgi:hypothetical protein
MSKKLIFKIKNQNFIFFIKIRESKVLSNLKLILTKKKSKIN